MAARFVISAAFADFAKTIDFTPISITLDL
jgi:hypothetical protein